MSTVSVHPSLHRGRGRRLHSAEAPCYPGNPGAIPHISGIKCGIDPRAYPGNLIIHFIPGSIPEAIPQLVWDRSQGAGCWDQGWDVQDHSQDYTLPHILSHKFTHCWPAPPCQSPSSWPPAPYSMATLNGPNLSCHVAAVAPALAFLLGITARFPPALSRCGDMQGGISVSFADGVRYQYNFSNINCMTS